MNPEQGDAIDAGGARGNPASGAQDSPEEGGRKASGEPVVVIDPVFAIDGQPEESAQQTALSSARESFVVEVPGDQSDVPADGSETVPQIVPETVPQTAEPEGQTEEKAEQTSEQPGQTPGMELGEPNNEDSPGQTDGVSVPLSPMPLSIPAGVPAPIPRPLSIYGTNKYKKPEGWEDRRVCGAILSAKQARKQGSPTCLREHPCKLHCGAFSKTTGLPCQRTPILGTTKCRMHGGATPSMLAAPTYKGLDRSKYLPRGLKAKYEEAVTSPDLLSVRGEIGLVQVRISELASQLDEKASREVFAEIEALWAAYKAAVIKGEKVEAAKIQNDLDAKMAEGAQGYQKWNELIRAAKDKAHLTRVEIESMVDMHAMISVEKVVVLLNALAESVKQNISGVASRTLSETTALSNIAGTMTKLLGMSREERQR